MHQFLESLDRPGASRSTPMVADMIQLSCCKSHSSSYSSARSCRGSSIYIARKVSISFLKFEFLTRVNKICFGPRKNIWQSENTDSVRIGWLFNPRRYLKSCKALPPSAAVSPRCLRYIRPKGQTAVLEGERGSNIAEHRGAGTHRLSGYKLEAFRHQLCCRFL